MSPFEISVILAIFIELLKKYMQLGILDIDMPFDEFVALVPELHKEFMLQNINSYQPIFSLALQTIRTTDIYGNMNDRNYARRMTNAIQNVVVENYKLVITQWLLSKYSRSGELDISYESFALTNIEVEMYYKLFYPEMNGRSIFNAVIF
jgi:hypothetical protein